MRKFEIFLTWLSSFCLICSPLGLDGCSRGKTASGGQQAAAGDQNTSPPPASGSAQQNGSQEQAASQQQPIQLPDVDLSPAGLDELLAPIALYPDPVIAVILQASVDPQQVMDGGNWLALDQNQNLKEAALDQASQKAGFTPVMQALLHYPSVVDMMCTEFDWTKQLGAAYSADPKSVLGSVQRLRAIAVDNGALKTSAQMKVSVKQDQGQDIVEVEPANPKVIYVPSYDPQRVFSTTTTTTNSDGSTITTTTTNGPAPSTSTNTVVVQQQKSGVSTESAVLIGLLSFGAGIAVGAAINSNNYYYPRWGYGGVYYGRYPYYPPPYRPYYGPGWGPSYGYGYNRPVHYGNNNIYINNTNNYYNRFNNNSNMKPGYKPMPVQYNNKPNGVYAKSMGNQPGSNSGVKYNRPNNGSGNAGNAQTRPATQPARPGNGAGNTPGNNRPGNTAPKPGNTAGGANNNWKGQTTYQGNRDVRTAGVQTLEQQMAVQGGARLERRRAGISLEMATSIEGMDSRVGDDQIRQRLPRVPLPETRRPGPQRGIRLQTGPRRIIRRLVRRHSLRAARSSNLNLAVRSAARAILARIARRAIAVEQAWERHSSHKAAVIAVELRGVRGNAK
jgi:hypothetical protein